MKVFLSLAPAQPLPEEVGEGWDICLAVDPRGEPAKLEKTRQGWLVSDDIPAVFTAVDIRARSDHLEKIEQDLTAAGGDQVNMSVIICTYNRPGQLADTLRSIASQTMDKAAYEILIVDNQPGSGEVKDAAKAVQEAYFQEHPGHIRVIDCPVTGLSQARNAGLSEAKGELVYFIDDDAAAEPNTLEVYADLFSEHPTAGVIGGQILFKHDQPLPRIWREGWEKYWSHFTVESEQYRTVENWWEFPWGANWCARKTALKRIGGFRTGYGRRGEDFSGGEEIVAASLIKRLGYSIGITPRAVVTHQIDESRISLHHIKRTLSAGMLTAYQAEVELRLSPEGSSSTTLGGVRRLLDFLGLFLRARREERQAVMMETAFFVLARARILIRKTRDIFRKIQRPLTAE
jgi:GT2 family glycosyltransferase